MILVHDASRARVALTQATHNATLDVKKPAAGASAPPSPSPAAAAALASVSRGRTFVADQAAGCAPQHVLAPGLASALCASPEALRNASGTGPVMCGGIPLVADHCLMPTAGRYGPARGAHSDAGSDGERPLRLGRGSEAAAARSGTGQGREPPAGLRA